MPTLLTLPRELRDRICEYVIFGPSREPPTLNQTFEQLVEDCVTYRHPTYGSNKGVTYRPAATVSGSTALRLVNRQLNAETLVTLARIRNMHYDLDVVLADQVVLVSTWTCVPMLTTTIEQLNITFRISGSYDIEKAWRYDPETRTISGTYARFGREIGWCIVPGWLEIHWQLNSLLERFMRVGPLGEQKHPEENLHFVIKTLNINVETPANVDPANFGPPANPKERSDTVLDPACFAKFLGGWLEGLVGENAFHGSILFEHVDYVVVSHDGKEISRIDVAKSMQIHPARSENWEYFWGYQNQTRREKGLRVLD